MWFPLSYERNSYTAIHHLRQWRRFLEGRYIICLWYSELKDTIPFEYFLRVYHKLPPQRYQYCDTTNEITRNSSLKIVQYNTWGLIYEYRGTVILLTWLSVVAHWWCWYFNKLTQLSFLGYWALSNVLCITMYILYSFRTSPRTYRLSANKHWAKNHYLARARAIIKVLGHQYWWLAGWWLWPGNRTFVEVANMVVSWWIVTFLCSEEW